MAIKYTLKQYRIDELSGIDFDMFKIQSAHLTRLWFAAPYPERLGGIMISNIKRKALRASRRQFMVEATELGTSRSRALRMRGEAEKLLITKRKNPCRS